MDFGEALRALKNGKFVRRTGWNGKNMHVYLEDSYTFEIGDGVYKGKEKIYDPYLCLYTSKGTHQSGWLASQADMLSEDWEIIE